MCRNWIFLVTILFLACGNVQAETVVENWWNKATTSIIGNKAEDKEWLYSNYVVKNVQAKLLVEGFNAGGVDGKFGKRTAGAISQFQKKVGLPADGAISNKLLKKLGLSKRALKKSEKTELEKRKSSDVNKATAVGAVIGGVIGVAAHDELSMSEAQAGIVGIGIGATAGKYVGNQTADKRQAYSNEHQEVNQAIAASEKEIETIGAKIAQLRSSVRGRNGDIRQLNIEYRKGESVLAESQQLLASVEKDLASNKELEKNTRVELRLADQDLKNFESSEVDETVRSNHQSLLAKRDDLQQSIKRISGIQSELIAQKQDITSLGVN